jgi:hypothetical protein
MHTLVFLTLLSASGAASGLPTGAETPRATDLFRAQRMADDAKSRLEMPRPSSRRGWARGGTGWTAPDAAGSERSREKGLGSRRRSR